MTMTVMTATATTATVTVKEGKKVIPPISPRPKKVIPPISRPSLEEFGIGFDPDFLWKDGVYICQHGKKQLYFSCFLPLCQNFDRIEVGSLYMTEAGLVRVKSMHPDNCIAQHFDYIVINEQGNEERLLTWEFLYAYW
jgi:hypothetical protein